MELINQHQKKIMESCKVRARDAGLCFDKETLEYIVTNRDLLELSPKVMIPTLYDYWVNDVEVLKETGKYKLYPHNPYETVINSRPAISFYNDNNPDWLNIMIYYHVLAHIDFFQNNILFKNTWNDDFVGQALADKRLIESLRSEYGRWVDYVIEFCRCIDNITGFFYELTEEAENIGKKTSEKLSFYLEKFLQDHLKLHGNEVYKEIERYNALVLENSELAESIFFVEVRNKYPEFQSVYEKSVQAKTKHKDLLAYIRDNSPFLQKEANSWMKLVLTIIRNTALYFSPQIRTKIINEGWASYWHDELFRTDERIKGHEVDYAKINAGVTAVSRIGLNPYAIGLRLIQYAEELFDKGKVSYNFQKIQSIEEREKYDKKTKKGREKIFELRKYFSDYMLIKTFVDQDFVDMHELFVVGKRMNEQRGTIEYYIKSRKAEDYKKMLIDSLYHPPVIKVDEEKTTEECLFIKHQFEGKQLYKDYICDTLMGISFLWGGEVKLETTEILINKDSDNPNEKYKFRKVIYHMKDKKCSKYEENT